MNDWICCQLGAREHYAVPRALLVSGLLGEFITDLWIRPGTFLHSWKKRLTGRFHPGLAGARVKALNVAALTFELKASLARENGWKLISRRNEWFQEQAIDQLAHSTSTNGNHTVFAYSYAAEEIFKFAKDRGWRTVLGQIDPGPAEEGIVAGLDKASAIKHKHWEPAPTAYWKSWHIECALADQIVVNSEWSRDALLAEAIPAEKIRVIPVAYESSTDAGSLQRLYPRVFSAERPLRVLFLGQINLRKGVAQLLEAVQLLSGEHVEFWFVGPTQIHVPQSLRMHPQVRWFGVSPRVEVASYYRDADVFVFPTLSDGFGLTQLEAQSWKLPVIASRYCGEVVRDGFNGVILEEVSGQAIADALQRLLRSPETLSAMSVRSAVDDRFSLKMLAESLQRLAD
ncbi:MAG TPA: glycosyltransferase family 4 protein [Pyrinomonadaceae bacterium]|nr:glycosyltransferase family 4 protein [Pyrinomonadaceae bacterium]